MESVASVPSADLVRMTKRMTKNFPEDIEGAANGELRSSGRSLRSRTLCGLAVRFVFWITAASWVLWLGGFTFYGAFVIDAAHDVLGEHRTVGFITRRVTEIEHLILATATVLSLATALFVRGKGQRLFWFSWIVAAVGLVALVILHQILDRFLDPKDQSISDRDAFYTRHRIYLTVATIVWGAAILHLFSLAKIGPWKKELPTAFSTSAG